MFLVLILVTQTPTVRSRSRTQGHITRPTVTEAIDKGITRSTVTEAGPPAPAAVPILGGGGGHRRRHKCHLTGSTVTEAGPPAPAAVPILAPRYAWPSQHGCCITCPYSDSGLRERPRLRPGQGDPSYLDTVRGVGVEAEIPAVTDGTLP